MERSLKPMDREGRWRVSQRPGMLESKGDFCTGAGGRDLRGKKSKGKVVDSFL